MIKIDPKSIEHCFNAISHHPDRWARSEVAGYEEKARKIEARAAELAAMPGSLGIPSEAVNHWLFKFAGAMRAVWNAESRCMSSFIVGPAKFPVRQQEKRRSSVDNRRAEAAEIVAKALKSFERIAFPHGLPGSAIRSDNPDAVELLEEKVAKMEAEQAFMAAANKVVRAFWKAGVRDEAAGELWDRYLAKLCEIRPVSPKLAALLLKPDYPGAPVGFAAWQLSNNGAGIRAAKVRIEELKKRAAAPAAEPVEHESGLQVVENVEANRLQLFFPGRPPSDVRDVLKRSGFRWAPSCGAWQSYLNPNAKAKAQQIALVYAGAN